MFTFCNTIILPIQRILVVWEVVGVAASVTSQTLIRRSSSGNSRHYWKHNPVRRRSQKGDLVIMLFISSLEDMAIWNHAYCLRCDCLPVAGY